MKTMLPHLQSNITYGWLRAICTGNFFRYDITSIISLSGLGKLNTLCVEQSLMTSRAYATHGSEVCRSGSIDGGICGQI